MNSDKIADLYSAGDISGFAYLACVEREIYTVEDAVNKGIFNSPSPSWAQEIEPFVEKHETVIPQNQEPLDENSRSTLWNVVKEVYSKQERYVDVRTFSALKMLQKDYPDFESYFGQLILEDGEFWVRFRSLRAIGIKSIRRAHDFAESVVKELESRGISLYSLFASDSEQIDSDPYLAIEIDRIIREAVIDEMADLTVRSCNALKLLLQECNNSYTAFYYTIVSKDFDVKQMRNVGRKSTPEITDFIIRVQARVIDSIDHQKAEKAIEELKSRIPKLDLGKGVETECKLDYDDYKPFFEAKMHELSARSYHAVSALFTKCGSSVSRFIEEVERPDFQITSLPAVGRKTAKEISSWISNVRGLLLSGSTQIDVIEKDTRAIRYSQMGMKGDVSKIDEVSSSLGHFALFTAIDQYLNQLSDRDSTIIKGQLKIYSNQVLFNRKEGAKSLGISPERMRQIRISQFNKLLHYVRWLGKFRNDYSVFIYKQEDVPAINNVEGTSFNENFILWAISVVWHNEYKLFGDVSTAFTSPYGYELNLALIPSSQESIFDFKGFLRYFNSFKESKRPDNLVIPIRDSVLQFFKDRIYYESIEEIEKECRLLLSRVLGYEVLNDSVIIEKNAVRNNAEWAELIIREFGHPLTADEIFEELEKRQPGKSKSALSLAGALRNNPNLAPIGRSSTYGLKEWTMGEHRGGTIREFATEYLLSLPMPIAPLEDIGKYVRQYRPSSSDKSIHSNLLLEANGAFSLFYDKTGNRCIGLSSYDFGDDYRRYDPIHDSKRDFKTSCTLLEKFIATKGRMPYMNKDDEEEMRLCRFWGVQQTKYNRGQLDEEEAEIVRLMLVRFAQYRINRHDIQWLNNYNAIKQSLSENGGDYHGLSPGHKQWIINQRRAFESGRMPDSRIEKFLEIITMAKNYYATRL